MNASFRLRLYSPADFETLYQLDQACYPTGIAYSRRTLRGYLAMPGAECLIAEAAGEIAGFILTEAEEQQAQIITIDVLEALRRKGRGKALLLEAEKRLAARGVRQVHLETAHDNVAAIAFWKKHGYRTRGVLRGYYLGRTDAFSMVKDL